MTPSQSRKPRASKRQRATAIAAPLVAKAAPWAQRVQIGPCTLYQGDCVAVMAALEPSSVHAVVTDPPYELGFMGKAWDKAGGVASRPETWAAALLLLTPGGHLSAFAGSRTYHRIACAIEDAGFDIRDQLMWIYGSGFPKSHDIAKCIDKRGGCTEAGLVRRSYPTRCGRWGRAMPGHQKGRPSLTMQNNGTVGARH